MWSWEKKKPEDIDNAVKKIEVKVDELIAERDALKLQLDNIINATVDEEVTIDFESVKVFSIERNVHQDEPCTIVGFLIEGNTVMQEWYLYCSPRRHRELIQKFEDFKLIRDLRVYNKEST